MEVNFSTERAFKSNKDQLSIFIVTPLFLKDKVSKELLNIQLALDKIGLLSAKAQNLKQVITTYSLFMNNIDQKLYIFAKENVIYGFLKTGYKKLFVYDQNNMIKEIKPLCVLDFYVHESQQRNGIGKKLFDYMLYDENISAEKIAYDRPSIKLLNFLSKYFSLSNYTPQNNNFVVYNEYFNSIINSITSKEQEKSLTSNNNLNNDSYRTVLRGGKIIKIQESKGNSNSNLSNIGERILRPLPNNFQPVLKNNNTYLDNKEKEAKIASNKQINNIIASFDNLNISDNYNTTYKKPTKKNQSDEPSAYTKSSSNYGNYYKGNK